MRIPAVSITDSGMAIRVAGAEQAWQRGDFCEPGRCTVGLWTELIYVFRMLQAKPELFEVPKMGDVDLVAIDHGSVPAGPVAARTASLILD